MFLKSFFNSKASNHNNNPDWDIVMQDNGCSGFCEACNGCSFYFLASMIKNLLVKKQFFHIIIWNSACLFLKFFLILPNFSLTFLIEKFLTKLVYSWTVRTLLYVADLYTPLSNMTKLRIMLPKGLKSQLQAVCANLRCISARHFIANVSQLSVNWSNSIRRVTQASPFGGPSRSR